LFFCVLFISSSISLIFSRSPMVALDVNTEPQGWPTVRGETSVISRKSGS
jgi:hypothetical protein